MTQSNFVSLSRGHDWIMCPLCFEANPLTSAREGGRLSTTDNGKTVWDVCVECAAKEWLYFANLMGA